MEHIHGSEHFVGYIDFSYPIVKLFIEELQQFFIRKIGRDIVEFESLVSREMSVFFELVIDLVSFALPVLGGNGQDDDGTLVADQEHCEHDFISCITHKGLLYHIGRRNLRTHNFIDGCECQFVQPSNVLCLHESRVF